MALKNHVQVAAAIIRRAENVLIAKRPMDKHKGGYWEFPGGKIEPGESPEIALAREITEEVSIIIRKPQLFSTIDFEYPEKKVSLQFYSVTEFTGKAEGLEGQEVRWVPVSQLANYQFPEANLPIVEALLAESKNSFLDEQV